MKTVTENKVTYIASTPAGSLAMETESDTFDECVEKLLEATAHMPYKTWSALQRRGYTVDKYTSVYGEES